MNIVSISLIQPYFISHLRLVCHYPLVIYSISRIIRTMVRNSPPLAVYVKHKLPHAGLISMNFPRYL